MTLKPDEKEKLSQLKISLQQTYNLILHDYAREQLKEISKNPPKEGLEFKIKSTITKILHNPHYPGLNSHHYSSLDKKYNRKIWESYVENNCPGAYRIFWHFGDTEKSITIILIIPHP
jgi:hypothetical protein